MIRTQIQLDETTHALAKQRAYAENKSLAAVVREALTQYLVSSGISDRRTDRFNFIASGRSGPEDHTPLSEFHDDALAEDFLR